MNYIKKLENTREQLIEEKREGLDALLEFYTYLQSAKFHNDTTVQVGDIMDRLNPVKASLIGTLLP